MTTSSLLALRLRRAILLGLLLALGTVTAAQAQVEERLRTTVSTGVFTLLPRQTVRLHLVDVGRSATLPSNARVELRDDRGTLLGFRTARWPGPPIHLVLRSANLLGSRPFLYVRAVAVIETEIDDLASAPIFSFELQPEGANSLTIGLQCSKGPSGGSGMVEHFGGGGCHVIDDLVDASER